MSTQPIKGIINKSEFVLFVMAALANPNGDPLNGNRPRSDFDGYGYLTDVNIKRKIRNRLQELGHKIFVQQEDRSDDGAVTLKDRAIDFKDIESESEFAEKACERWLDVRAFGAVFPMKGFACPSVRVRGPVSINIARSVDPINITTLQITKSVSGDKDEKKAKGSDTMGTKHVVDFALYKIEGTINSRIAEKTGLAQEDVDAIKEALRTLYVNDASSARPEGSMRVAKMYWFDHNNRDGQYPSWQVHESVQAVLKDDIEFPKSLDDYKFVVTDLEGLKREEIAAI